MKSLITITCTILFCNGCSTAIEQASLGEFEPNLSQQNVKLASKSLDKALKEVTRRGLDKFEKFENKGKRKKISSPKAKQAA